MKVSDLIFELNQLPSDLDVVVAAPEYWDGETIHDIPKIKIDWDKKHVLLNAL